MHGLEGSAPKRLLSAMSSYSTNVLRNAHYSAITDVAISRLVSLVVIAAAEK